MNFKNNTIVCLNGGLGNQLFQYALGRSLSLYYDSEITFYKPTIYGHAVKREFQLDLFLGMFKQFQIKALSGFISSPTSGVKTEDTSMIVTIAANGTASDRSDVVGIVFKDYDNNNFEVEIPITQTA